MWQPLMPNNSAGGLDDHEALLPGVCHIFKAVLPLFSNDKNFPDFLSMSLAVNNFL